MLSKIKTVYISTHTLIHMNTLTWGRTIQLGEGPFNFHVSVLSACPALSAHAERKSQGHCRKLHHEAESLMMDISAIDPKELIGFKGYIHNQQLIW